MHIQEVSLNSFNKYYTAKLKKKEGKSQTIITGQNSKVEGTSIPKENSSTKLLR